MLQGQKAGSKDGDEDVKEDLTQCWTQAGPHLQEFAVQNMQLGEDGAQGKHIGEEEIKEITATVSKQISEIEKNLAKAKQVSPSRSLLFAAISNFFFFISLHTRVCFICRSWRRAMPSSDHSSPCHARCLSELSSPPSSTSSRATWSGTLRTWRCYNSLER